MSRALLFLLSLPVVAAAADEPAARGVLRAEREAVLASPLGERITSIPFREGARFGKGATLVAFDCARMSAELAAARAGHAAEARNAQMQTELLGLGAAGKGEADIAVAHANEKRAQAQSIEQRMVACRITAPFAGRVVETLVRESEAPPPNKDLIRIVSSGPLELSMVLPSRWLGWMQIGSEIRFKVDETGDLLDAKVTRIAGAVDAVSQTVKVIASVTKAPDRVLPGMSGQVSFPGEKR
ncbi:efflux RND transporter periplasmic adaptor subunit [Pelomonas sp. KK5]|uniref:efflux RND transporter periplasmic adaptor subunit n=1 Tax=Pelomonas sp. KK5 TaxID=1855730 RepID=UPI00097C89BF|nr:efflux RND transporter periplasmic adaptor subunit [Pelomonas sp. KK5]